ncbi:TetR/AcrR family transcriptional regulator [Micromonospora zhanjiangensis]|uniref:TetR/AcrR family transcriptional regulator n=1 Tax=Micromonospora zhanjiangensis TaxID=1522057 RepID=A0ABV8KQE4_9ACTN
MSEPTPLVWDLPAEPRGARLHLSQAAIAAAAIRVADADGEHAVTMRRVAKELGAATPMSLYRYVGGKDGIIDLMLDQVFGEIGLPKKPAEHWRESMHILATRSRGALRRHPWFTALAHQRPLFGPNALAHNEWSLTALAGLGLPIGTAMSVVTMVFGYAVSYAQNEAEEDRMRSRIGVHTDAELRATAAPYIERIVNDGRYPLLARWISEGAAAQPDDQFLLGLDCLLDGIQSRILNAGLPPGGN